MTAGPSRRQFLAAVLVAAGGPSACDRKPPTQDPVALPRTGPQRSPLPAIEPILRVRVMRARDPQTTLSIGEPGQELGVSLDSGSAPVLLEGPLEARLDGGGWVVSAGRGRIGHSRGPEPLEVTPSSGDIRLAERAYPGALRLVSRSDVEPGAFDVVNLVRLEEYLPGVVAGELLPGWRGETRAAQAVAARSFAASEHAQHAGRRAYDLTSTPHSQVYLGRVRDRESTEAVAQTRGTVLAWEGMLVPGYYSACCGGLAAAAVDAIGTHPANDVAPLRGHGGTDFCADAQIARKVARWTVERPTATLARRLVAWARRSGRADLAALEGIAAVEVAASNAHGRPTRYVIRDARGRQAELPADRLRAAANHAGPDVPAPSRELWSGYLQVTVDGERTVFEGRGLGHGAGLCQYGAEAMARAGGDFRAILEWYYPGAQLVRAYA